MTEASQIQLGQPENPALPYTHLVPLLDDLVRRGNPVARRGAEGDVFFSNQGGYLAILTEPLDIDYLRRTYDLTGYHYLPDQDLLFDAQNWVSLYGSGGRLA